MNEQVQQQAEWRARLTVDIISHDYDAETKFEMLTAGLNQAHAEGLMDAIQVIEAIAATRPDHAAVLNIVSNGLRKLNKLNAEYK